jgi:hypothetical protein
MVKHHPILKLQLVEAQHVTQGKCSLHRAEISGRRGETYSLHVGVIKRDWRHVREPNLLRLHLSSIGRLGPLHAHRRRQRRQNQTPIKTGLTQSNSRTRDAGRTGYERSARKAGAASRRAWRSSTRCAGDGGAGLSNAASTTARSSRGGGGAMGGDLPRRNPRSGRWPAEWEGADLKP